MAGSYEPNAAVAKWFLSFAAVERGGSHFLTAKRFGQNLKQIFLQILTAESKDLFRPKSVLLSNGQ